ncbi:hypothetical protein SARC_09873, partial [Sphaeroforma arctica JP610]
IPDLRDLSTVNAQPNFTFLSISGVLSNALFAYPAPTALQKLRYLELVNCYVGAIYPFYTISTRWSTCGCRTCSRRICARWRP